ncbi:MAG: tail fiber domain-containing protein, partial [Ferruginibacter sp.]
SMGYGNNASGDYSFASGTTNSATGFSSIVFGQQSISSSNTSIAMGASAFATSFMSIAIGQGVTSSAQSAVTIGSNNKALSIYSMALGYNSISNANSAITLGNDCYTTGDNAVAIGNATRAKSYGSISIGSLNDTSDVVIPGNSNPTDRLFQLGNGTVAGRSNAITVLRSGSTGFGTVNPTARIHVVDSSVLFTAKYPINPNDGNVPAEGAGTRMFWFASKAAFRAGAVSGSQWDYLNIGTTSFATGDGTTASGGSSAAFGVSTAASGVASFVAGSNSQSNGWYSAALGENLTAKSRGSMAVGVNNESTDNPNVVVVASTDRIFQVGNGASNVARSNALTILRNGNIGLGNNNTPDVPLSFANTVGPKISLFSNGVSAQYGMGIQSGLLQIYTDNSLSDIAFGNGGSASFTERMRIKGNGNVGIGTNNPQAPLSFPETLGRKIILYPSSAGGNAGFGVFGNELRIAADYSGASVTFGYENNSGVFVERMRLTNSTGVLTVNGTNYPSDARFKENITAIENPLEKIMAIRGVEYNLRANTWVNPTNNTDKQVGVIAQEVERVLPQAVSTIDASGYKGVDYAKIVPLLIEAIKAQQTEIETLKTQVKKLQK